jgi:RHS repeat-associated protein
LEDGTIVSSLINLSQEKGMSYDPSGNLLSLTRTAYPFPLNPTNRPIDSLRYHYYPGTNRLRQLQDLSPGGTEATLGDLPTQTDTSNYIYNTLGQLVEDKAERIRIFYNAIGKVTKVIDRNTGKTKLSIIYDSDGKRLIKYAYSQSTLRVDTTLYVAKMVYENGKLVEIPITGGILDVVANRYYYHLNDHIGSVRAVVARKLPVHPDTGWFQFHADYYPFGWPLPGRTYKSYRYGYQGQEYETETGYNVFDFRMYDARLGRWISVDPLAGDTPGQSPYAAMDNNPVHKTDPDGKSTSGEDPIRGGVSFGARIGLGRGGRGVSWNLYIAGEIQAGSHNNVGLFASASIYGGRQLGIPANGQGINTDWMVGAYGSVGAGSASPHAVYTMNNNTPNVFTNVNQYTLRVSQAITSNSLLNTMGDGPGIQGMGSVFGRVGDFSFSSSNDGSFYTAPLRAAFPNKIKATDAGHTGMYIATLGSVSVGYMNFTGNASSNIEKENVSSVHTQSANSQSLNAVSNFIQFAGIRVDVTSRGWLQNFIHKYVSGDKFFGYDDTIGFGGASYGGVTSSHFSND